MSGKLFHKRKARKITSLNRRKARLAPYDRVLIVCEDGKSSPAYLKGLCADLRLSSANIEICGEECGSAPISVVNYAINKTRQDRDFDRVFCVLDVDRHDTLDAARDKARRHTAKKIDVIVSNPCFELWLLLHYQFTARPYGPKGKRSACDCVIKDLKEHLTGYAKSKSGVYSSTKGKLSTAVQNATNLTEQNRSANAINPSTQMHKLVSYLQDLKK